MSTAESENALKSFTRAFGPGVQYRAYAPADEVRLKDRIPTVMHLILRRDGWCSYREQLLWLCDPDDWRPATRAWFSDAPDSEVLARSAFGDLFVLDNTPAKVGEFEYERTFWSVLPHYSDVLAGTDDPDWFFQETLTDKENVLDDLPMVQSARATCGPLEWDEMYTFVPAIALGGSVESSNVERVKAMEQLAILSQLAPIRRL